MAEDRDTLAMLADIAAMKSRGWAFWEILCSTQTNRRHDPKDDHIAIATTHERMSYAPLPSDDVGVWAPAPDKHGAPVLCDVCGAPVVRRAYPVDTAQ